MPKLPCKVGMLHCHLIAGDATNYNVRNNISRFQHTNILKNSHI